MSTTISGLQTSALLRRAAQALRRKPEPEFPDFEHFVESKEGDRCVREVLAGNGAGVVWAMRSAWNAALRSRSAEPVERWSVLRRGHKPGCPYASAQHSDVACEWCEHGG